MLSSDLLVKVRDLAGLCRADFASVRDADASEKNPSSSRSVFSDGASAFAVISPCAFSCVVRVLPCLGIPYVFPRDWPGWWCHLSPQRCFFPHFLTFQSPSLASLRIPTFVLTRFSAEKPRSQSAVASVHSMYSGLIGFRFFCFHSRCVPLDFRTP